MFHSYGHLPEDHMWGLMFMVKVRDAAAERDPWISAGTPQPTGLRTKLGPQIQQLCPNAALSAG